MNAAQEWATIIGGILALLGVLGIVGAFISRPLKKLADDLAPLTDKNSDGDSVFTDMRAQLQQLVDEFPKNGVPARAAFDALKLEVAGLVVLLPEIKAEIAEVKASQDAHVKLHMTNPTRRPR